MEELVIENGVLQRCVGSAACIRVPDGVREIREKAFLFCEHLERVELPAQLRCIGDDAFSFCPNLRSAQLPEGLESIGARAFFGSALETITIPKSVRRIGERFVNSCSALREIRVAPGNPCFQCRDGLLLDRSGETLVCCPGGWTGECRLPSEVRTIASAAFEGCAGVRSITLPAGLQTIEDRAFEGCSALEEMVIPSSVQALGNFAFSSCWSLRSITLPEGVQCLGEGCFWRCVELQEMHLPASLREIRRIAFTGCAALREFTVAPESPFYHTEDGMLLDTRQKRLLCCPGGRTESCRLSEETECVAEEAFFSSRCPRVVLPRRLAEFDENLLTKLPPGVLIAPWLGLDEVQLFLNRYRAMLNFCRAQEEGFVCTAADTYRDYARTHVSEFYDLLLEEKSVLRWFLRERLLGRGDAKALLMRTDLEGRTLLLEYLHEVFPPCGAGDGDEV